MMSTEERLATLEAEMRNVSDDVAEIKASLKVLERIAARGGGFFHATLMVGGFLGWLAGTSAAIYAMFRH
jgi:hypothetical protein